MKAKKNAPDTCSYSPKALYDKIAEDPFGDNGLFEMNLETSTQQLKYEYTEK